MSTREALAAALEQFDAQAEPWTYVPLLVAAALERLAQLPEKCGTCDDPHPFDLPGPICPDCHGSGRVYPAELVERIGRLIHKSIRIPNFGDSRRGPRIELSWEAYQEQFKAAAVAVLDALNRETP